MYTCYLRILARTIGELTGNPGLHRQVPKLRRPRPRTQIATTDQLSAMLANAEPWMRVFITLALALGLRHAEALDAYVRCRTILGARLGIEPSPETRGIYERLLHPQ